ncbi:hypothetical protein HQ865_12810 [Mucilaginibacter mali]|uniref:TANFOR domain-containing protein n=1 Tax=Mucilaginibacter mali TaxID=2740462 RepID=A0A7D4UPI9_9SPHI|nr:hypothetical protein [Mucilaginibacter mali]QKJ30600.1 hypothetical protein HQ865_12810 [Mucilaginibacter mali]
MNRAKLALAAPLKVMQGVLLLALAFFGAATEVSAQANLITNVNISLPANPNANTANWGSSNSLLTITASTQVSNGHINEQVLQSTMLVSIKKGGSKVCGQYTSSNAPSAGFNTIVKTWSGANATSFLGQDCTLQPGSYEISVQFFYYNTGQNKLMPASAEKTKAFTIAGQNYQPPQTLNPVNNAILTSSALTQPITLKWTPVTPAFTGPVTYRIKIWQLLLGQTASQAKNLNTPLVTKDVIATTQTIITNLVSGPCQPPYTCNFVWTVQAIDGDGQPVGSNSGTSSPATFGAPADNGSATTDSVNCSTVSTKAFAIGDEILLSDGFVMKLTSAPTGTNSSLSGNGSVKVKWLGLLSVKFKNISINGDNRLCSGAVYTNTDADQEYPTQWGKNFLNKPGDWISDKVKTVMAAIKYKATHNIKALIQAADDVATPPSATPVNMPFGYFKGGDTTTAIGFTEMVFKPDRAELEVIASLNTQGIFKDAGNAFNGTDAIALQGRGIRFKQSGLKGINGSIMLVEPLVFTYANTGTESLKMTANVPGVGHIGNGIEFSSANNEFWNYKLDLNIQLPKQWLIPVDKTKTNVDMNFQSSFARWGDYIIQGSLPACIIPHCNGLGIEAATITYDHSDIANATGMVFPAGYAGDTNTFFSGFYMKDLKFTLPDVLRSYADTTKNIQIVAENLIIDRYGLSGKVYAANVLNYPYANIGNMGGSIDTVKIAMANSALTEASLTGKITLPLSSTNDATSGINYSALFLPSGAPAADGTSSFTFALHPAQDVTTRFLGDGKIKIDPSSSLSLVLTKSASTGRNIALNVDLNGSLYYPAGQIIDPGSILPMDLDLSCAFQHLGITYINSPQTFTFTPGQWSFASPQKKLSGFPFTIEDVKAKLDSYTITDLSASATPDGQYLFKGGVEIKAKINIGSENSNIKISGDTKILLSAGILSSKFTPPASSGQAQAASTPNLSLLSAQSQLASGNVNSVNSATSAFKADKGFLTQLKPQYLGVQVETIHIETQTPAVSIKGDVEFYKHHPTYGNGFKGDLTAKFTCLNLGIQAGAIFGNTKYIPNNSGPGFKYWMVEAQVNLPPPGIPFLTGVAFRGFGAGVYSRMNMTPPAVFNPTQAAGSTFGGAVFTPDASVSMGFKAKAIIATTPKEETLNGSVALGAQFNTSGGINFIQFDGLFNCGAAIGNESQAFANGAISVSYNFPNKVFDMNSQLLINKDPISTDAPGIQTKLHIDGLNNKWFFMSGTPTLPNKIKISGVAINSYLMFGNDIEKPQGFMQETRDGFARIGHTLPNFADNATSDGKYQSAKGFAFGIGVNYYNGDSWNVADWEGVGKHHRYLTVNYSIDAGAEIDASFMQYNGCTGLGKGWRARASVAVYAGATLGYAYDLPLLGAQSGILGHVDGSAYAIAEFPNPTYLAGSLDGDFSIGGYSVGFHKSFQKGTPCAGSQVVSDPALDNPYTQQNVSDSLNYSLIKDFLLTNGSTGVSRKPKLAVELNYMANQPFDVQEQQSTGQIKVRKFRAWYTATLKQDSLTTSGTTTLVKATAQKAILGVGGVNQGQQQTAPATASPIALTDAGYDDIGAKLYKLTGTGTGGLNVTPLKSNTSYKFEIKGELQEFVNNSWQAVKKKNTNIAVTQTERIYFKTNNDPVSNAPVQQSTAGAVAHHL